jgi:hypothetical protein
MLFSDRLNFRCVFAGHQAHPHPDVIANTDLVYQPANAVSVVSFVTRHHLY